MASTIQESVSELHTALSEYIEATYHIGNPVLVKARQRLLNEPGNVHQVPFLESTPRYVSDRRFNQIEGLSSAAISLLQSLADKDTGHKPLLHDPPYKHQADAIEKSIVDGKNLLIMTGTGSGKTESFLMPVLSKLAIEASAKPGAFGSRAVRALLLYPMNALVNDQLGRLRSIFSDPRVTAAFSEWAGRIPQFARYTSRTPYAGVRDKRKDDSRLKSLEEFYVTIEREAEGNGPDADRAQRLWQQLHAKGKWPAKPSLAQWLGNAGSPWQKRGTDEFIRAVTLPDDSELITRHEVQHTPPDLLITNYSMLEYMLMRPIERSIFDHTKAWLEENPEEKFLIILDEAHLYRGAGGAEVGLLIRRLTDRLGVSSDRIQAICATASFSSSTYAREFGAQLSGCPADSFEPVTGTLKKGSMAHAGTQADAAALVSVDVTALQHADTPEEQAGLIAGFLGYRNVTASAIVDQDVFAALEEFGPLQLLVNETMGTAKPLASLAGMIFPCVDPDLASKALSNLLTLGSRARAADGTGLLPCRVHSFFRGFPGLWACMDPECNEVSADEKNPYCGKVYSQPIKQCKCGATCLEFYTCRHCGAPYARAYTDHVEEPTSLWPEPGANIALEEGDAGQLEALDLLLQEPIDEGAALPADYDVETGRLNGYDGGIRSRRVYLRPLSAADLADDDEGEIGSKGQFIPCGICRNKAVGGKSSVQDHMTKGDQPFQALVARQIQIQPQGPKTDDSFAPLRGRKVLAFSDSRQVAARLAPNLQTYSMLDALRPLLIWGTRRLQQSPSLARRVSLQDSYFATLLAARCLSVRLRPELKSSESFDAYAKMGGKIHGGGSVDEDVLGDMYEDYHDREAPASMLNELMSVIGDRYIGLEALALGSLTVMPRKKADLLNKLPDLPGFATTESAKLSLVGFWLRCWRKKHIWFAGMDNDLWQRQVHGHSGKFKLVNKILPDKNARATFAQQWVPALLGTFTESMNSTYRLHAQTLYLELGGKWVRCSNCASVHRPIENYAKCVDCGKDTTAEIDPEQDDVFVARKGYYRRSTRDILKDEPVAPMALIAAEHTAQLNSSDPEDAFSKAERNELLFQDINIAWHDQEDAPVAIDILSSTTTMEVGIDIGALSGVALRNMPPGRANYQQRAGRAGRRGNAVATVVAFGSVDSHDEHYFSHPEEMISGEVVDPVLTLNNQDIARRHLRAFLLQCYHQDRLPKFNPLQSSDLFSVLGKVGSFRDGSGVLNLEDFGKWLFENEADLKVRAEKWLPEQLTTTRITELTDAMVVDCLKAIDEAIESDTKPGAMKPASKTGPYPSVKDLEGDPDVEEEKPARADGDKLLDRLLYEGVLPRYAFPTDVATFHIFDREKSNKFRHKDQYSPSQGLPVALSQYAPGKQVWVGGKCYVSGAIYSRSLPERLTAWDNRELYYECSVCRFAETRKTDENPGGPSKCPACGSDDKFEFKGPWIRPVGFAHPVDVPEETSPDRVPEVSYATRAKLTTKTPGSDQQWVVASPRFTGLPQRTHLLVSNVGPKAEGYRYCAGCGRIEAMTEPNSVLTATGGHRRPYPTEPGKESCMTRNTQQNIVLGTRFVTDIALFSLRVDAPMNLRPGTYASNVALRTVSEALARSATDMLGIEPGEILAEHRPAMSADASSALCSEIFLYDTLPGGAGFSSAIPARADELLTRARGLLANCPEQCDSSCYRCLRAFGNRIEHRSLDRHVGIELIDYLLTGQVPETETKRLEASADLLFKDVSRLFGADAEVECERNAKIMVAGNEYIAPILIRLRSKGGMIVVGLSSALKEGHAADSHVRALQEKGGDFGVVVVNELLVRSNLPAATKSVCTRLGQ
ncbi:DEAD/DEAH box helicase [Luteimonas sp. A478]